MKNPVPVIRELHERIDTGEGLRYWVNDSGPVLNGLVTYPIDKSGTFRDKYEEKAEGWLGIVDDKIGGMIMYVEPKLAEEICDALNVADIMQRLAATDNTET
jgi:hypothetical protein